MLVADGEHAIQALVTAAKRKRQEGTVVMGKPRYDSKVRRLGSECTFVCARSTKDLTSVLAL